MKYQILKFKPLGRLMMKMLYASSAGALLCATSANATEYDKVSEEVMSYDTACDALRGCYQIQTKANTVMQTSQTGYVIGQDNDGKSIEIYSVAYIDGKLASKQETDYNLSQRLLENRNYTGSDQHLNAAKDYQYDVYNRTSQEAVKNYDDNGLLYQTNYLSHQYDDFNLDKEIQSELTSTEPGHYKSYAIRYDILGRAISKSYELDGRQYQTIKQYDGADRSILGSDFNANVSATVYDDDGHLSQMVSYHGDTTVNHNLQLGSNIQTIHYQYDNYSRLIEHSLNNNSLGYDFNSIGLQTSFSIASSANQSQNLKASSHLERIVYDSHNRVEEYGDYNGADYTVSYKPDSEVDSVSMQSTTRNLSGILSHSDYEYDGSVSYWLKGQAHTQTIEAYQNGHQQKNVITRTYYSPDEVVYTKNIGQPKTVQYQVSQDGRSVENLTITYAYDDQKRVISQSYTNQSDPSQAEDDYSENNLNKTIHYAYDPLNRITKSETLFTSRGKQADDVAQQIEEYTYNINGDVTQHITTKINQDGSTKVITNDYAYDEINQLLQRTESTNDNGQVDQVEFDYIYDGNGNIIAVDEIKDDQSIRIYEYKYNNWNQMIDFEDVQNNQNYVYSYYPDGKRSSKSTEVGGALQSIKFLYGQGGSLLNEEYSQNGQLQKSSSYFVGLRFIDDLINKNDSLLQFPLADRRNHPLTVTFSQGQSDITSYHLTDYGKLEQSSAAAKTDQQQGINFELNPKIYGSGYYDSESHLQYMGARYYSADIQRFMAQDSYNLLNRYNYANGNPVMNYDPDGHSAVGNFAKGVINGLTPNGVAGLGSLGSSVLADFAITGVLLARGAVPGAGQMSLIIAFSGGVSNSVGTAVGNMISGNQQDAYDLGMQAFIGAVAGGLIGGGAVAYRNYNLPKAKILRQVNRFKESGTYHQITPLKVQYEMIEMSTSKEELATQRASVGQKQDSVLGQFTADERYTAKNKIDEYVNSELYPTVAHQDLYDKSVIDHRYLPFKESDWNDFTLSEAKLFSAFRARKATALQSRVEEYMSTNNMSDPKVVGKLIELKSNQNLTVDEISTFYAEVSGRFGHSDKVYQHISNNQNL